MLRRAEATRGGATIAREPVDADTIADPLLDDGANDDAAASDADALDDAVDADTVAGLVDTIADKADAIARRGDTNGSLDGAIEALNDAAARLDDIIANWDDTAEALAVEPPPSADADGADPSTTEQLLSNVLAEVMEIDDVPYTVDFFDDLGADSMVMAHFCAKLRKHPDLPSLSIKEVYASPSIRSLAETITGPDNDTESLLASLLAEVMELDDVPYTVDFFDDLGADSMVMAHFCAKLRKHPDLPSLSIKEVYASPSIRSLAETITGPDNVDVAAPEPTPESTVPTLEPATRVPTWEYVACGAAQLLTALGLATVAALIFARLYEWVSAADGVVNTYARATVFGGGLLVAWSLLPIIVKWMLIGRSQPTHFRVWSLGYLRFWFVRLIIRLNPLAAFVGTPVFALYLRALGADIGRGVLILSRQIPVHTDLLSIGDHAVVRKDSSWSCYRADAGWIQTGPVTIGRDAVVGESTVLDIYTSLGDGAQLGHSSALHAGQSVPDGEHRQGTPAIRCTEADLRAVEPTPGGRRRRVVYSSMKILFLLLVTTPVALAGVTAVAEWRITSPDFLSADATSSYWVFNRNALIISFVLYFGLLLTGLVVAFTVPRVLRRLVRPGEVYPLYGTRYWAHRTITRLTNVTLFTNLFGDSSYIVHYLYCLGYDVSFTEQTGANFGMNVKHDNPYCVTVGPGTMAADGLSIANTDYSDSSFRVSPATIGSHSFFGNFVVFPSQATTGDDCLLASKVLVPVDGDRHEHVGFLGSPSFEIPRKVARDRKFDDLGHGDALAAGLSAKNRHNLVTMGLFLMSRWATVFVGVLAAFGAIDLYARFGAAAIVVELTLLTLFASLFAVLVEHASVGFKPLHPVYCSLYEPGNWRIERFWKLSWQPAIYNGTPFKILFWRLMGVQIGKRVFDDGCVMTEKTLISVGDDCVLNAGSLIQPHSQEDGTLKVDYITVGDGCTLGVRSLVHYGVTMGDGASLDANAFLMKGADVASNTHWAENPAREIRDEHSVVEPTVHDRHTVTAA